MKNLTFLSLAALLAIPFSSAGTGAAGVQLAQISDGFDPEARYMAACFACHSTGAAGTPRVGPGNAAEWAPRLEEKGLDAIVESTVTGIGTMPPKGLCFDCTPEELRAIVEFMLESSD
ncbi:MAG: cytochrome c5 family protein [Gammaproteobacteria bacterium]|nr:cytochrome c5 family protein [Gammaproteobacteria bacterium]MYF00885.1 cytochrome c5 family protein [Gammaproteobacteria bacterium]